MNNIPFYRIFVISFFLVCFGKIWYDCAVHDEKVRIMNENCPKNLNELLEENGYSGAMIEYINEEYVTDD